MNDYYTRLDRWGDLRDSLVDVERCLGEGDFETAYAYLEADREIKKGLQWARINFAIATIFLERFDDLQGIDTRRHWTYWPADWVIELDDLHRAADPLALPADVFDSMVLQNALYFLGVKIAGAVWGEDTTIQ